MNKIFLSSALALIMLSAIPAHAVTVRGDGTLMAGGEGRMQIRGNGIVHLVQVEEGSMVRVGENANGNFTGFSFMGRESGFRIFKSTGNGLATIEGNRITVELMGTTTSISATGVGAARFFGNGWYDKFRRSR